MVASGTPVADACADIGVSRTTYSHWRQRFASEGLPGLADRSSRPRCLRIALIAAQEQAITGHRTERGWGPHRIALVLRYPWESLQADSFLMAPSPVTSFSLLREQSRTLVARAPTRPALRRDRQIARLPPRSKTDANHSRAMPHAAIDWLVAVSTRFFSQSFWLVGIPFGVVGILDGWALHSRG